MMMRVKKMRWIGAALALVILAALTVVFYNIAVRRPNFRAKGSPSEVGFVVRPGEKVYEIAQHLREAGLVNSATLFKIYVKVNGLSGKLQAGSYKIKTDLSLAAVVSQLQHGTFDLKLIIPEGWRREEMGEYLAEVFLRAGSEGIAESFLNKSRGMEGYLFPDTYVVPFDTKAEDIIKIMKENFDRKVDSKTRSDFANQGLTLEQVVTLASIVEREAGNDKDRPVIAGIIVKRLKAGWPLEADATVQYALSIQGKGEDGWWPKELSTDDLLINSPYNTRRNPGLPPGPISNPGLSSIRAVVYPLETPYWFYLTDGSGETHFAKTLEEHEANISRYLR